MRGREAPTGRGRRRGLPIPGAWPRTARATCMWRIRTITRFARSPPEELLARWRERRASAAAPMEPTVVPCLVSRRAWQWTAPGTYMWLTRATTRFGRSPPGEWLQLWRERPGVPARTTAQAAARSLINQRAWRWMGLGTYM